MSETNQDRSTQETKAADLERRAQSLLQQSAEQLDGATRSRLTQARHAALDTIKQRPRRVAWLLPAGAAAAAVTFTFVMLNQPQESAPGDEQVATLAPVDAIDIVTAEDSLEFYRDVEFYAWLDTVIDEEAAAPESEA